MVLLPLIILLLVRSTFVESAIVVVIISKWRIFSVRPRYWLANIRANLVDITVGMSVIAFMYHTNSFTASLFWAAFYCVWLLVLKPRSTSLGIGIQAYIALGIGLSAIFNNYSHVNQVYLILATWIVSFGASRHFLASSEDESNKLLSHLWAVFAVEMALILGHWHILYSVFFVSIAQVALVLLVIGYSLGVGYYVHRTRGITKGFKRQLFLVCSTTLLLIVVLSEWQSKTF